MDESQMIADLASSRFQRFCVAGTYDEDIAQDVRMQLVVAASHAMESGSRAMVHVCHVGGIPRW